ncbi:hypothetical protein CFTD6783_08365 [Campylobacter fetus subsp. testudinum]|uniref:hypothetical protein n=1 Tax=Campylobacter fetus TaxID=196 RepID=UPI000818BBC2|nr:hypothetical protein [Campylobacter fetus]OCS09370.1 hypothetical protein CFTD6783_08365 [Campylobacter fetus subsp. testudinum]
MQNLFTQPTAQVEILDFQTFSNNYVAKRYGIDSNSLLKAKNRHLDEIIENLHFFVEKNDRNRSIIKWTLRGIIKLGMFIRSPQAKNFRLWAEQKLEKSIRAELENVRQTKAMNQRLTRQNGELSHRLATDKKHQNSQINGYKSTFAKQKAKLEVLKAQLVIANDKAKNPNLEENDELKKRLEWLFKSAVTDGVIYAINSSRDKLINDALKKANQDFMSNLHLLKN